ADRLASPTRSLSARAYRHAAEPPARSVQQMASERAQCGLLTQTITPLGRDRFDAEAGAGERARERRRAGTRPAARDAAQDRLAHAAAAGEAFERMLRDGERIVGARGCRSSPAVDDLANLRFE